MTASAVPSTARPETFGAARARGFTLLEVMVALFVTTIGLLGIAKIEALAYSSTTTASMRSLVALQAAGLAATMHANRDYWAAGLAPPSFTITGTVISDPTLNSTSTAVGACEFGQGAPCTPAALAAYDLHVWAAALNAMMSNSSPVTTINCPVAVPMNCQISVTWNEKAVSINSQAAAATTATTFTPTYVMFVEP